MTTYKPDIIIEVGVDNLLTETTLANVTSMRSDYISKPAYENINELTAADIDKINKYYNVPVFFKDVNLNSSNALSTQIKSIRTVQSKLYDNTYMQKLINEGYRPIGSLAPSQNEKSFFLTMRYTTNQDTQPSDYFTSAATAGGSLRRRRQTKKRVVKRRKHKTNRK